MSAQMLLFTLLAVFVASCAGNLSYICLRSWQWWHAEFVVLSAAATLGLLFFFLFLLLIFGLWFGFAMLLAVGLGFKLHRCTVHSDEQPLLENDFALPFVATLLSVFLSAQARYFLYDALTPMPGTNTSQQQVSGIYFLAALFAPNLTPLFFWLAQNTLHKSPLGRD